MRNFLLVFIFSRGYDSGGCAPSFDFLLEPDLVSWRLRWHQLQSCSLRGRHTEDSWSDRRSLLHGKSPLPPPGYHDNQNIRSTIRNTIR